MQYGHNYYNSKGMPKDKSRSKLHHKDNLNEILSTLSKTHKAKVKKIKAEKSKLEDIDSQLQVKKCVNLINLDIKLN